MPDLETQCLVLRPDVVASVLEDGAVLLDLQTNYFYELNTTGWAILQLFEAGTTLATVKDLCRQQGTGPADAAAVKQFLAVVTANELLAPSAWEPAPAELEFKGSWMAPTIEKAQNALQRIMKSAFDPTMPLAE